LRVIQGVLTIPMMMMGLKTFPVSIVEISMGMGPIISVLLAWIFLKEKTQCFDIFSIIVGIIASFLIILS
jgi:EamA domain-containing membrane protein RarD